MKCQMLPLLPSQPAAAFGPPLATRAAGPGPSQLARSITQRAAGPPLQACGTSRTIWAASWPRSWRARQPRWAGAGAGAGATRRPPRAARWTGKFGVPRAPRLPGDRTAGLWLLLSLALIMATFQLVHVGPCGWAIPPLVCTADVRLEVGHVCARHRGHCDGNAHPAGRARLAGGRCVAAVCWGARARGGLGRDGVVCACATGMCGCRFCSLQQPQAFGSGRRGQHHCKLPFSAAPHLTLSPATPLPAVGYPPVEARDEQKAAGGGKPAAQESLVSLLVNDCLKCAPTGRGGGRCCRRA